MLEFLSLSLRIKVKRQCVLAILTQYVISVILLNIFFACYIIQYEGLNLKKKFVYLSVEENLVWCIH